MGGGGGGVGWGSVGWGWGGVGWGGGGGIRHHFKHTNRDEIKTNDSIGGVMQLRYCYYRTQGLSRWLLLHTLLLLLLPSPPLKGTNLWIACALTIHASMAVLMALSFAW